MEFSEIYHQYMYSYPHKTAYRSLPMLSIADYLPKTNKEPFSLYFHIPFCESKCGYCNLFSITGQKEDFISHYLDAMERQAMQYSKIIYDIPIFFDSLILGGGTPLLLSEKQLERLFTIAHQFPFQESAPIIVETSPRQTTKEKLQLLKQYGITRISIGIQSFHDHELLALNRKHTVKDCEKSLSLIDMVGFSCRNIDLIYGILGQTKQAMQYSIDMALSYKPEELFLYPLYIKQGTGLFAKKRMPSTETYDIYLFASQYLKEHGYQQVSMRRFILASSKHTQAQEKSCGFENMLSLGCGARSYLQNLHFCTPYHILPSYCLQEINHFIEQKDYLHISFGYLLNNDEMLRRFVIKNLLHKNGLNEKDYKKIKETLYQKKPCNHTFSILADFPILIELLHQGLAIKKGHQIILTEQGLSLSDAIGPLFISNTVKEKMEQWNDSMILK